MSLIDRASELSRIDRELAVIHEHLGSLGLGRPEASRIALLDMETFGGWSRGIEATVDVELSGLREEEA